MRSMPRQAGHRHVEHGDVVVVGLAPARAPRRRSPPRRRPAGRRSRRGCASARRARCCGRRRAGRGSCGLRGRRGRAAARAAARRVPPRGARAISSEPPRKADALAHALAGRASAPWRGPPGAMPRPSSSTSTCSAPSSTVASATHAFFAPAWRAMLVSDSWIARYTAVATALETSGSVFGNVDAAGDARALGEVVDQPGGGVGEAEVVEHQRAQVGRDAPRRAHRAVEQRAHLARRAARARHRPAGARAASPGPS